MRITRSVTAVAVAVIGLAIAPAGASAQQRWVGLGDSFAAGPLIPSQTLNPLGCLRSTRNFARLAAASTGRTLTDVSCSGARTTHMTTSQSTDAGTNPPQFNALTATTNVVSVQIGGNDIGFSEILQNCATANPFGKPCQNRYAPGGVDQLQARIAATAPKIDAVLAEIRRVSPSARGPRRQLRGDRAAHGERLLAAGAAGLVRRAVRPRRSRGAERDARAARGRQERSEHAHRGHVRPEPGPGRLPFVVDPVGRAARAREHGGAVPPERAGHGGVRAARRRRFELALAYRGSVPEFHSEALSITTTDMAPGRGPALHRHPYEEVFVILEGEATFTLGDSERVAGAGDFVVAPPGVPHAFKNTGDGQLRSVNIHASPEYVTEWL